MPKKLFWDTPKATDYLVKLLQSGNIILGTSDTIPGLLAPISQVGFIKLNEIKEREEKPYIILIENAVFLSQFAKVPANERLARLIETCWPGPLTLIFKANAELPSYAKSRQETVAARVPDHEGLLRLLQQFQGLFSTSANKAGDPSPQRIEDVDPDIAAMASCIVTDRKHQGPSKPSTILDCTQEKIHVIREGAYSITKLQDIYGERFEW